MGLQNAGSNYAQFTRRWETFHTFPPQIKQRPEEFAAAGFIYTNMSDYVKCVYCSIKIGKWLVDDDIAQEHKKHSPGCFIPRLDSSTNVDCPVCKSKKGNTVLGCGHGFCLTCTLQLDICGICKRTLINFIPLYI